MTQPTQKDQDEIREILRYVKRLFDEYQQGYECLVVHGIPHNLYRDFELEIVKPNYRNFNDAIIDLMRKALEKKG